MANTPARMNNNPLNLRPLPNGEMWKGQKGVMRAGASGMFCVFDTNRSGIRAATINMRSYVNHAGVKTLRDTIYRWAPPGVDNNHTDAYVSTVVQKSGLDTHFDMTPIALPNPPREWRAKLVKIISAMNFVEAGERTVTDEEIREGVDMALGLPQGHVRTDDGNVVRGHMAQSKTIATAREGQITAVASTAISGVSAFSMIQDWKVALVVAGIIVASGAFAIWYFSRVKSERMAQHDRGIA